MRISIRQISILPNFLVRGVADLVLPMSKVTNWHCYLCIAGVNSVSQDPHVGCGKPLLLFSLTVGFLEIKPGRFFAIPEM